MQRIDEVYENLKERIFQAEFKPNVMITEREISEHYGVSRVTAGEALHRLCHEGHLTSYPRTGYMVTSLSPTEMMQIERIRITLETLVIEVLCENAKDEELDALDALILKRPEDVVSPSAANRAFHLGLARTTHDPYIYHALDGILGAASRVGQYVNPSKMVSWQDMHREILDALRARDLPRAKEKLLEDIQQR